MKTLHLYLLRQVVGTLLMTVAVLAFVLLLGNVLREIVELLVNRRASWLVVIEAVGYLLPWVLVFALPMGLLTATLLVFGRFSADQELTAARASGVSLLALVTPVLLLSVVLSGVSAWFNLQIGPQCRVAYKELLFRFGLERPAAWIQENQPVSIPGYILYVGKVDGEVLKHVLLYQKSTNAPPADAGAIGPAPGFLPAAAANVPGVTAIYRAATATYELDTNRHVLRLRLPQADVLFTDSWTFGQSEDNTIEVPVDLKRPSFRGPPLSDMTMGQLLTTYYEHKRQGIGITPVIVQMHRQVAFSFACIGFTLVGIPLAVRAHHRETSAGVGLALVLVLVYHSFVILAQAWETYPERQPHLLLWIPNFLFQGVGAWLLWRANRRG